MKGKICGCLLGIMISTSAIAQTSVTLFGAIDAGVTSVSNGGGHSDTYMQGGISNNTGFGLSAIEDIGGGTKVFFKALNAFDIGTGSLYVPNTLFGRYSYVGMSNDSVGTLKLGLQPDMMFDYMTLDRWGPMLASLEPTFTQGGPFSALGLPDMGSMDFLRTGDLYSTNNAVSYKSPQLGGLNFGVMYGFGGQAGEFSQDSTQSAGASYTVGPVVLDAAYTYTKFPTINSGNSGLRDWAVGGRTSIGGGGYFSAMIANARNTFNSAGVMVYDIAMTYPIAPATILGFEYQFNDGNSAVNNVKAHQAGVNLAYYLSKSTSVYAFAVYQRAFGGIGANALIPGANAPSTSDNQTMVRIGIMHMF